MFNTVSPNEYAEAVKAFSALPIGSNCLSLGEFLIEEGDSSAAVQIDVKASSDVALIYSLTLGVEDQDGQRARTTTDRNSFQSPTQLYEFQPETSCIVFFAAFYLPHGSTMLAADSS